MVKTPFLFSNTRIYDLNLEQQQQKKGEIEDPKKQHRAQQDEPEAKQPDHRNQETKGKDTKIAMKTK